MTVARSTDGVPVTPRENDTNTGREVEILQRQDPTSTSIFEHFQGIENSIFSFNFIKKNFKDRKRLLKTIAKTYIDERD